MSFCCCGEAVFQLRPMTRRVVRVKSVYGRIFSFTNCVMRVMLPDWICLSALIWSSTCDVTVLTRPSGVDMSPDCANAPLQNAINTANRGSRNSFFITDSSKKSGLSLSVVFSTSSSPTLIQPSKCFRYITRPSSCTLKARQRNLNDGNDGIRGGTIWSGRTEVAPGSLAAVASEAATDPDAATDGVAVVAEAGAAPAAAPLSTSSYFGRDSLLSLALLSPPIKYWRRCRYALRTNEYLSRAAPDSTSPAPSKLARVLTSCTPNSVVRIQAGST